MMYRKLSSVGDTIVEVLIATSILSSIIVGGYVAANRAAKVNQASQERSEAVKVSQRQLEGLKALLSSTPAVAPPAGAFCVTADVTGYATATTAAPAVDPFTLPQDAPRIPYSPAGDCGNFQTRYNIAIRKNGNTYEIMNRWNRITGGFDEVILYYRVY